MTVEYKLEIADLLAFANERRGFISPSYSKLYYYAIVPALMVALALATQSFTIAAVFTTLYAVSGWYIQRRMQRAFCSAVYTEENFLISLGPWRLALTDDGLDFSSDAAKAFYRWTNVKKVLRTSRYIYIMLTPVQRIHIPIRAFNNEELIQQFITAAQSHIKTSSA